MKKKLQRGFTLVELIIVMALMGLIMTALVIMMRPSRQHYENIVNRSGEENVCIQIGDVINGSLRYSTGVQIICGTETIPSVDTDKFQHAIKLGNDYRDTSVKGGRGVVGKYICSGSTFAEDKSVLTNTLLEEYDIQFGVSYNTKKGSESMTISMEASPIKRGDSAEVAAAMAGDKATHNPDFVVDTAKTLRYSETFEFINLRQNTNGELGVGVAGYTVDTFDPATDTTIWIFYQNPTEAALTTTTTTTTPPTSAPSGAPTAAGAGDLSVADESSSTTSSESSVSTLDSRTFTFHFTPTTAVSGYSIQYGTDAEMTVQYLVNADTFNATAVDGKPITIRQYSSTGGVIATLTYDINSDPSDVYMKNGHFNLAPDPEDTSSQADSSSAADSSSTSDSSSQAPTYGTYTIHVLGSAGDSNKYNFNVSNAIGADATNTAVSADVDGTYSFTTDKSYMEGSLNYNWNKIIDVKAADLANGQNKEVWLYKGTLYNDEVSAQAAKTAAETPSTPDSSSTSDSSSSDSTGGGAGEFNGTVTVNYSTSQNINTESWGNPTGGYLINESDDKGWARKTTSETFTISPGESVTISIYTINSGFYKKFTFTYDQLSSANATNLWISYGQVNTSKPADWAP